MKEVVVVVEFGEDGIHLLHLTWLMLDLVILCQGDEKIVLKSLQDKRNSPWNKVLSQYVS